MSGLSAEVAVIPNGARTKVRLTFFEDDRLLATHGRVAMSQPEAEAMVAGTRMALALLGIALREPVAA